MPGRLTISLAALVLVNLVPLAGAVLLGWKTADILLLFWIENVIIGVYTVARMLARLVKGDLGALGLIPFFTVHYGLFCAAHGFFLIAIFNTLSGGAAIPTGGGGPFGVFAVIGELMRQPVFFWGVIGIVISHGVSFVLDFLWGGEVSRTTARDIMGQPYARIFVLHITIILGAVAVLSLGQPVYALALLVGLKIVADIAAHIAERRKLAQPATSAAPTS